TQLLTLYDFENLPGPAPDSSNMFTLRAIQKLTVDDHWSGSLRVDVPLVLTNAASSDDPDGGFAFGSGDVLTQAAALYPPNQRWAFAVGTQSFSRPLRARRRARESTSPCPGRCSAACCRS